MVASFPRPALYALSFVAFVPLFHATCGRNSRRAFALGWVTGGVVYALAWRWVLPTIARFEDLSLLHATPFFVLFVAYHAVQVGLFAAVSARTRALAPLLAPAWVASSWVVIEWCFPRVIPWHLGDALAPAPLLRQIADLGGAYLLSFLIVFVNASIATALAPTLPRPLRVRVVAVAFALVGVVSMYGWIRTARFDAPSPSNSTPATFRVAVVQGVIPSGSDDREAANEAAWQIYEELTKATAGGAARASSSPFDLVIWPETTLRVYLRHRSDYLARLSALATDIASPMLIGALDLETHSQRELNSAYLLSPPPEHPGPIEVQLYHKRRLLPFGETVPFGLWWQTTGDFVAAKETDPPLLNLPSAASPVSLAPSICFEAIFAGVFNAAVASGASFLVNITDDGWFGDTDEPHQHLNATILRAVETRRWLVRASNSGISAFIDPSGKIVASTALGEQRALTHSIEEITMVTPFVRYGNWPVALSFLVIALLSAIARK